MQKVLKYAVWGGIFAIPFIPFIVANDFFFPFITGKNFTFRIIVEIIFALWVILALQSQSARPKKSALWFALLLFVGSIGISAFTGENPDKSFWSNFERMDGWVNLVHLGAYFTVLVSMLKDEKTWKALWNTSIGVSVLVGLFGLFQLLGVFAINQGGVRVDATFGNATYLAVYMLFHVFMTLYALVRWNPSTWIRIGYGVGLVLQVVMIFYAATRGTTLGLLGGLFLSGLIFALFSRGSEGMNNMLRKAGIALVSVVLIISGGFVLIKDASFVQNNDILTRFASINLEEGQTRFTIWNMALQGVKERPVFGWGQENFNYVFNAQYQASLYGQEPWFDRAHNQFLDWLVAGGVFGFVLYVLLYGIALWYLWRAGTFDVAERAIFTGLLAGFAFHNLFVFDNLTSSILFLGVLGYITVRHTSQNQEISLPTISEGALSAASGAVVVLLVVAFYFANVPGMVRASGMISAIQPQEAGLEENFRLFQKAIKGGGVGRQEAHEQLVQFATQVQRADLESLSTPELRNEIVAFTTTAFAEEVARNPEDARLRVFYGSFLRQIGELAAAKEQLAKALALSPQKQAIMFELGLIATVENNAPEAVNWFKIAYEVEPEYDRARMLYVSILIRVNETAAAEALLIERYDTLTPPNDVLLQAYFDVGNLERAIQVGRARVEDVPTDINRYVQLAGLYIEAGQRTQAVEVLKTAIEINPTFTGQGGQFIEQIESGEI